MTLRKKPPRNDRVRVHVETTDSADLSEWRRQHVIANRLGITVFFLLKATTEEAKLQTDEKVCPDKESADQWALKSDATWKYLIRTHIKTLWNWKHVKRQFAHLPTHSVRARGEHFTLVSRDALLRSGIETEFIMVGCAEPPKDRSEYTKQIDVQLQVFRKDESIRVKGLIEEKCRSPALVPYFLPQIHSCLKPLGCTSFAEFCKDKSSAVMWAVLKSFLDGKHTTAATYYIIHWRPPESAGNQVYVRETCEAVNVACHFCCSGLPEPVDAAFFDTWRCCDHLLAQLRQHHSRIRSLIFIAGTSVDGTWSDSVRYGWDMVAQAEEYGYSLGGVMNGLRSAITIFLKEEPGWIICQDFPEHQGLTVLGRAPK